MLREQSRWKVNDKMRLLLFMMNELAGEAHISFEGALPKAILQFPGASTTETSVLKRSTLQPSQNFVILPLQASQITAIVSALGGTVPRSVLHIQIEKAGKLAFAAYDSFHPDCIFLGDSISDDFIERLISNKSIAPQ